MIQKKLAIMACVPALLLTITACSTNNEGNREVIKEPGKTITVIDDAGQTPEVPGLTLGAVVPYEGMEIFGWVDEDTIIVAKDNEALGFMKLEELSDSYPRSLYAYNTVTKSYELLKEQSNTFLGGAELSPDRKHLIYQEYSLGDPVFHVMNLETKESFALSGEPIGGAISARWADDGTIIGASYAGGAYTATTSGKISALSELEEEALFITAKLGDKVYYNTGYDEALKVLHLGAAAIKDMGLGAVGKVVPSPDGKQLLVTQNDYEASKTRLVLCNLEGGNAQTIAEGTELSGLSWSPDQRFIAYVMKSEVSGAAVKGLYVHDLLAGESTNIVADVENAVTTWSPSSKELSYTTWKNDAADSKVIGINTQE